MLAGIMRERPCLSVHNRSPYAIREVVDRAVFRTCRVHGYNTIHSMVVLNNLTYFVLCELCFPPLRRL
jgi:hypothetical protein